MIVSYDASWITNWQEHVVRLNFEKVKPILKCHTSLPDKGGKKRWLQATSNQLFKRTTPESNLILSFSQSKIYSSTSQSLLRNITKAGDVWICDLIMPFDCMNRTGEEPCVSSLISQYLLSQVNSLCRLTSPTSLFRESQSCSLSKSILLGEGLEGNYFSRSAAWNVFHPSACQRYR